MDPDRLRARELRRRSGAGEQPTTAPRSIRRERFLTARSLDGVVGLRQTLISRPEVFVGVMTEKLLTYALGRGVEYYDMPAVRKIVHDAGPATSSFRRLCWESSRARRFR